MVYVSSGYVIVVVGEISHNMYKKVLAHMLLESSDNNIFVSDCGQISHNSNVIYMSACNILC